MVSTCPFNSKPSPAKNHLAGAPALKGSWDLAIRVRIRVTILISTYNPN